MKQKNANKRFLFSSIVIISLFSCFLITPVIEAADTENKGSETFKIDGGKRGNVPFPHWQHQAKIDDCNACHSVFPQVKGSIRALKTEGKLKKKRVMNKLCTKCHRDNRKAGKPSGPTSCNTCHVK